MRERGIKWKRTPCSNLNHDVFRNASVVRYNDERTQRFGLECKSEADWEELQRCVSL